MKPNSVPAERYRQPLAICGTKSLLIFRNRVNPSAQKYSASVLTQITRITPPVSPDERALANVTNARWDAVDADGATDVRAGGVR
jgi:hypothetical protein